MEGYLNTIYYGAGAYGAGGSQYYFGKDAGELTLAEAAMLAGIEGPAYFRRSLRLNGRNTGSASF